MRIPHAVVGALRNLIVQPAHKKQFAEHATLFTRLTEWLAMPNAHIQFACVMLLRALAAERSCRVAMRQHGLLKQVATVASERGYVQDDSAG